MDSRYEVFASKGKGVFSTVLRARDLLRTATPAVEGGGGEHGEHAEVAIKMIRANDTMTKAAQLEVRILNDLKESDPDNKKHCIRLLRTFDYRHHVCLVFEPMVSGQQPRGGPAADAYALLCLFAFVFLTATKCM